MSSGVAGSGNEAAVGRKIIRAAGAIALVSLLALGLYASAASAEPLSMTFTEDRANVGEQLFDDPMFAPPATAPFEAQIDPVSGSITGGVLQVPEFSTEITHPFAADVTVDFEIGTITGSFDKATGALTLSGVAGGTLTSEGHKCTVSTDSTNPPVLTLSTTGSSGGTTNPRSGTPFTHGLTGAGAIAGEWTNMHAEPLSSPGDDHACEVVEENIEGPGGIWLVEEGDVTPPSAPQLTGTDPASPSSSSAPRILGAAEAGSTVRVYAGAGCAGLPVATGTAAELGSPGIRVVVESGTAAFSATATDAAANTSACSATISYTRVKAPGPGCIVPKLAGKTLARAKAALTAADCKLGTIRKPKRRKGKKLGPLVVKSSKPGAGAILSVDSKVDLRLGPKPRLARRTRQ